MTKFEEELFNKVPCKFELTTEAEYKKSTLINHFKNWRSDEEFQELLSKYSSLNDNYEKEVIKSSKLETSNLKLISEGSGLLSDNATLTKEIADLKSQLQQQALPVVPDYVGNAVMKINLEHLFTGYTNGINEKAKNWLERHKGVKSLGYYVCQLRFQGFTIEKPQLFYLKNKLTGMYLYKKALGGYGEDPSSSIKNLTDDFKFTQSELDSMETGSYELVPVEDGE